MAALLLASALVVSIICGALLFRQRRVGLLVLGLVLMGVISVNFGTGIYVENRWQLIEKARRALSPGVEIDVPIDAVTRSALRLDGTEVPQRASTIGADSLAPWLTGMRLRLAAALQLDAEVRFGADVEFLDTVSLQDGLRRTLVLFRAEDGARIPGYLFEPPGQGPFPAVVVVPGHVKEGQSGLAQTAGLVDSYQHGAARALAHAGFVTFTFELRGFGLLGEPYHTEHRIVAWNAILAGTSYKSLVIRDFRTAVNWVRTLPQVDAERLAVSGVSYGGELAVTYAALDPGIRAVVFQGFGGAVGPWRGKEGTRRDQPHYCHVIPGLRGMLLQEDLFYLLAPRPVLGIRGTRDGFANPSFEERLEEMWRRFNAAEMLELKTFEGGHEYFIAPAVEFLHRHL